MDSLRGQFPDQSDDSSGAYDHDIGEDETGREPPPSIVGQDERRMQVRAYNFWAGMLQDRNFPAIEDLNPENLSDFGPYSVLLDFTAGIEDPAIGFLGDKLALECGTQGQISRLSDVPSRSLLSRITDHYLQILANQAPIGFEAEFVNQRGVTILYRGILLPFSSDDDTIDFIFGVINWKELADQKTADELLLEIDQALDPKYKAEPEEAPQSGWAEELDDPADEPDILELGLPEEEDTAGIDLPEPEFAQLGDMQGPFEANESDADEDVGGDNGIPFDNDMVLSAEDPDTMGLADWLASARELAEEARGSEERTRQALYAAIGRAYDFYLAAQEAPEEYSQLVEDAGLSVQERAPLTPVVKLVFGVDYDKTRLTEYATVLGHAKRLNLERGALAEYIATSQGGLKGIVEEERRLRRGETGKLPEIRTAPRKTLAKKLRKLDARSLAEVPAVGSEFTLLLARRTENGEVVLLGEIADDIPLIERAAKHLLK